MAENDVVVDLGSDQTSSTESRPRPRALIAILLLVALVVAVIVTTTRTRSDSDEALTAAIAAWESTFNAGDVAGYLELFNESSVVGGQLLKLNADFEEDVAWLFGWNPHVELSQCRITGPRLSSCLYSRTDDFQTVAGLEERGMVEFALDPDDGKLARIDFRLDPEDVEAFDSFFDEFHAWVESNHPEVTLTGVAARRDRETWAEMRDAFLESKP